jgi:hypothetical protein
MGNVNTKTFILLLAQQGPLSFASGVPVDLADKLRASNRTEFHHVMPRSCLTKSGQERPPASILANFAFLSRADNRMLGGDPPSKYRRRMPSDVTGILARALCSMNLFGDKYEAFVAERAKTLATVANRLVETAG